MVSCFREPFDIGTLPPTPVLNGVVDAGVPIAIFPGYALNNKPDDYFVFDTAVLAIATINGIVDTLYRANYYSLFGGYAPAYLSKVIPHEGDEVAIQATFANGTISNFKATIPLKDSIYFLTIDTSFAPNGQSAIVSAFNIQPHHTTHLQLSQVLASKWRTSFPPQRYYPSTISFVDYDVITDPVEEQNGIYTFQANTVATYDVYTQPNMGIDQVDTLWYNFNQLTPASYTYLLYASNFLNDIYNSPFTNLPQFPGNVTNAAGFILVRVPHTFAVKVAD